MNRTIKIQPAAETANNYVYYAPVASTKGDKVTIYRFGFEQECSILAREILAEHNPLRKAMLRHQMVCFIREHIGDYSGDRAELLRGAATLAHNAFYTIEETILITETRIRYTKMRMRDIEQEYNIKAQNITRKPKPQNGVIYTTSTIAEYGTAQQKAGLRKLSLLQEKVRELKRQLDAYHRICPPSIAQAIIKDAEMFEGMGY